MPAFWRSGMRGAATDRDLRPGVSELCQRRSAACRLAHDGPVRGEQSLRQQVLRPQPAAVLLVRYSLDDEFAGPPRLAREGAGRRELGGQAALRVTRAEPVQEAVAFHGPERVDRPQTGGVRGHGRLGVRVRLEYEAPAVTTAQAGQDIRPPPLPLLAAGLAALLRQPTHHP